MPLVRHKSLVCHPPPPFVLSGHQSKCKILRNQRSFFFSQNESKCCKSFFLRAAQGNIGCPLPPLLRREEKGIFFSHRPLRVVVLPLVNICLGRMSIWEIPFGVASFLDPQDGKTWCYCKTVMVKNPNVSS